MKTKAGDKLQETILLLAYWARRASEEEGLTTTTVVVFQRPSGIGVVNVYVNGELKEAPFDIVIVAQEVANKACRFASGVAKRQIKAQTLP